MREISAVIITLNEEKNIERCIASLAGVADDIVVVDSFSTDQTEAICRRLKVRFVKHAFAGYAAQKNWALTQSRHGIVLSLDADEALSDDLKQSIVRVKANWQADAYSFNRLTNYCGRWIRHCGWYPDTKIRLWDTAKGRWGDANLHEKVVMGANAKTAHLEGDLLHYTFYTLGEHVAQVNKFSEIKARGRHAQGRRASLLSLLVSPMVKFVKGYLVRGGFLDGRHGFYVCALSSFATFLTCAKLFELQRKGSGEE
jgi:glycosyltransferase involved in cell wall biosynthesis